jgi:osmotically-inducible protein OsmY
MIFQRTLGRSRILSANLIQAVASARPKLEIALPDAMIRQKLLDELKKQSWTHIYNLGVTVNDGVVELWGYAQSDDERNAIRVAAEAIPGVASVDDHLADSPVFAY